MIGTSSVLGPCTPSTRLSSTSLVALGPLIQLSGQSGPGEAQPAGSPGPPGWQGGGG